MLKHNLLSKVVLFLLALIFIFFLHRYERWESNIIGGGDGWGYYMFLPALFIHGDLGDMKESIRIRKSYHAGYNRPDKDPDHIEVAPLHEGGRRVMKYTIGLSLLYMPFFLLAHFLAGFTNYPADGYSQIYIYVMHWSVVFFVLMGLVLLRKVLLHWLNDKIVALTLLVIGIGTNLHFFTVYNSAMAHAYLFSLYCLLIFATQRFYLTKQSKYALLVGFAAGFITLIRPTEIICLAIPLFWSVSSIQGMVERFRFIGRQYKNYLLSILTYVLIGFTQLIYWKWASGDWLYYSYREEGFDFTNPRLVEGLFGFKNGWLAYTPVMVFALIGIYFLFRKRHPALLPIVLFLPIHIYVTYSWWCWNYINGMGSRPMVEAYALLSIPLAFFFQKIVSSHRLIKGIACLLLIFFIGQNMFQTEQTKRGVLLSASSNWAFYKRSFGKTKLNYLDLVTFDSKETPPDESKLKYVSTIYENNYEDSLSIYYQKNIPGNNSRVFRLNNKKKFGPALKSKIAAIPNIEKGDWIKISVDAMREYEGNFMHRMSALVVSINPQKKWVSTRIDNKIDNQAGTLWYGKNNVWDNVYIWIQIPDNIQPSDELKCYAWNNLAPDIFIDNFKVELYKKR